eukprot:s491_g15.t1
MCLPTLLKRQLLDCKQLALAMMDSVDSSEVHQLLRNEVDDQEETPWSRTFRARFPALLAIAACVAVVVCLLPAKAEQKNAVPGLRSSISLASDWSEYVGRNCYPGHGGVGLSEGYELQGSFAVEACKAECEKVSTCAGIVIAQQHVMGQGPCWRLASLTESECLSGTPYNTWQRGGVSPVTPEVAPTPVPAPAPAPVLPEVNPAPAPAPVPVPPAQTQDLDSQEDPNWGCGLLGNLPGISAAFQGCPQHQGSASRVGKFKWMLQDPLSLIGADSSDSEGDDGQGNAKKARLEPEKTQGHVSFADLQHAGYQPVELLETERYLRDVAGQEERKPCPDGSSVPSAETELPTEPEPKDPVPEPIPQAPAVKLRQDRIASLWMSAIACHWANQGSAVAMDANLGAYTREEPPVLTLTQLRALVLDEADRLLGEGFEAQAASPSRQTLLFSATWPVAVQSFSMEVLKDPVEARHPRATCPCEDVMILRDDGEKPSALAALLLLVTSTIDLLKVLQASTGCRVPLSVDAIHGDRSQRDREAALQHFRSGATQVLLATDVAGRGIDVKASGSRVSTAGHGVTTHSDVNLVVNYDMPRSAEDYVHRIGRTGRNNKGVAVSILTEPWQRRVENVDIGRDDVGFV